MREYPLASNKNSFIEMSYKNQNHKCLKVLKALLIGIDVEINGNKLGLAHNNMGGFSIVVLSEDSTILGDADMSFSQFTSACNKISDEEYMHIIANIALNTKC